MRKTNHKSILEIHDEIRNAQKEEMQDGSVVIGRNDKKFLTKLFLMLPGSICRLVWKRFLLKPFTAKEKMGSIIVTSVGMYSSFDGWVIPTSIHPLCFAIGSIQKKPGVFNDNIAIREYLNMTVLIDHDVMDGAPAARFLTRLDDLLKNAHGLSKYRSCTNQGLGISNE